MNIFDKKAEQWDSSSMRLSIAKNAYEAIVGAINFDKTDSIIDFGAGTGLLSKKIALHVKELLAIDSSKMMLEQLDEFGIKNITTLHANICEYQTTKRYKAIVSSMTMHHILDLDLLFAKLYELLQDDGIIAIVDIMSEDGSFHKDNNGVHHFGFDENTLMALAQKYNFKEMKYQKIFDVNKEGSDYGIFMLTAKK